MKLADVMSGAGLSVYAEIALLLFLLAFVVVGLRLVFSSGSAMERMARLPLEDASANHVTPIATARSE